MSRKALGRGLSALIAEDSDPLSSETGRDYLEIDIDLILPNSEQPRTRFPEPELIELAQSIRSNGIVQPILVRPKGKQYQIVAGERRWRAAQRAELAKIPAVIRDVSDDKLLELALIENIQRQELNPIEEAKAYKKLIEKLGLTQEKVVRQVGKTRTFITNYLRLLKLPQKIIGFVEEGKLSVGHARALLAVDDEPLQMELAGRIMKTSWSVRETENAVKKINAGEKKTPPKIKKEVSKDPNIKRAESKLRRYYGTHVRIEPRAGNGSGRIEFEYYGDADLDRLYKLLMKK